MRLLMQLNIKTKSEYSAMSLNCKSVFKSSNVEGVKNLLNTLSNEDVFSIAQTASCKKIFPETREEAIDTILIYTPEIERFFSYRRITCELLSHYLYSNNVRLKGHATRNQLIVKVLKLWEENSKNIRNPPGNDFPTSLNPPSSDSAIDLRVRINETNKGNDHRGILPNHTNDYVVSEYENRKVVKSDEFAHDFVEWFYSCLNSVHNNCFPAETGLSSSMFCSNGTLDLFLLSGDSTNEMHAEGGSECERLLREVIVSHRLKFSPNLETGTIAQKSTYGLVKVLACGSLHKDCDFIGVFEQEFGLVQSPEDRNWKIVYTKANLKGSVTQVPSLTPVPIFEIECS